MTDRTYNVLFLCTGNSCRSIIAEGLLNHLGQGRFTGYSAGSHPAGRINPYAVRALEKLGISTEGLSSKNWDEFETSDAPVMDFIVTVCDNAAGEACPIWPGQPATVHWGVPDPALFKGDNTETEAEFDETLNRLRRRILALLALPLENLKGEEVKHRLNEIGLTADDNT